MSSGGTSEKPAVRVGFLLGAAAAFLLGWWPHRTPLEDPVGYGEEQFSAHRAMPWIESLARAHHPTGSPENDRVRESLVGALRDLDLEVEVQESIVAGNLGLPERYVAPRRPAVVEAVRVRNIVARQSGSAPRSGRDAILFSAHYDSRPTAPGAGDDLSGVATILESLRALKSGAPLEREVIVLFSDAEELGLFGMRAFVAEHPWFARVGVAVNLEARGNHGASRMFETATGDAGGDATWIARLDQATGPIVADSLSASIYRAMPRDTDLTVLMGAGIPGYNFAFIRGVQHYHTALDRPEFLDRGTLQQQGEHALALVRSLGNGPLPEPTEELAVYFPLGPELWRFSSGAARALSVIAVVLALLSIGIVSRRGDLRPGSTARAVAGWFLLAILAGFATLVVTRLLHGLFSAEEMRPTRLEGHAGRVLIALASVGFTSLVFGWGALRNSGIARGELVAAGVLIWIAVTAAIEIALPNAGYLGSLPLLGGALVLLGQGQADGRSPGLRALSLIGALPLLALWPMVLDGIGVAFGPTIAPGLVILGALSLPILIPLIVEVVPAPLIVHRRAISATMTVLLLAMVAGTLRHDPEHPKAGSVHYVYDATTETAVWGSYDHQPGEWAREFLGDRPGRESTDRETLDGDPGRVWVRTTASRPLTAPKLSVGDDADRHWKILTVEVPSGTARLDLVSESIPLQEVSIRFGGGSWQSVAPRVERLWLHAPPERIELRLNGEESGPLELRATTMSFGLPEARGLNKRTRSDEEIESTGDRTYVVVRIEE